MKVRWALQAKQDRADILTHIAADNVPAAIAMDELFGAAAGRLVDFPLRGRHRMVPGTRQLVVHESYRLIYEVDESEGVVWLLALIHTARRWPPRH